MSAALPAACAPGQSLEGAGGRARVCDHIQHPAPPQAQAQSRPDVTRRAWSGLGLISHDLPSDDRDTRLHWVDPGGPPQHHVALSGVQIG